MPHMPSAEFGVGTAGSRDAISGAALRSGLLPRPPTTRPLMRQQWPARSARATGIPLDEIEISAHKLVPRIPEAAPAGARKALAWGPARQQIYLTTKRPKLPPVRLHEIFDRPRPLFEPLWPRVTMPRARVDEVLLERIEGKAVFLNCKEAAPARPEQPQAEATAPCKGINESWPLTIALHARPHAATC